MTESNSRAVQDAAARRDVRIASRKWKKGGSGKSYSQLTHSIFQSPQYSKLSPRAVKLLVDLLAQYRGTNNGDLTTAWSVMQRVGWKSKDLLAQATLELEQRGWIIRTRQGSRNAATLWALTFHGIDDCRGKNGARKFDAHIRPDPMALHLWRDVEHDLPAAAPKRSFKKTRSEPRLSGKGAPATGKPQDEKDQKVTDLTPYLSRQSGQSA